MTPNALSKNDINDLVEGVRSIRHADHLRLDMGMYIKAAQSHGINGEVLDFLYAYAQRVADLSEAEEKAIIADKQTELTQHVDLDEFEIQFLEREKRYAAFHGFIEEGTKKFAADSNQLNQLVRLYAVFANDNDRVSNGIIRENVIDLGRIERDAQRAAYNPDDPLQRRPPLKGGVAGGLERMTRHAANGTNGKSIYGESEEELDHYIDDNGQVFLHETITVHPTELGIPKAVSLYAQMYETKRELLLAPERKRAFFAARLEDLARQLTDPNFIPINVDAESKIDNFTSVGEIDGTKIAFIAQYNGVEEDYRTNWKFMKAEWGSKFTAERKSRFHHHYSLSSWITDDVDGNKNKKSEHSLLETVRNSRLILTQYQKRLKVMKRSNLPVTVSDGGPAWDVRFHEALRELNALEKMLRGKEKNKDLILSQKEYDSALGRLDAALNGISAGTGKTVEETVQSFVGDMKAAHDANPNHKAAETALLLSKLASNFGFHFAKKEYRQTADEHAKIIDHLLSLDVDGVAFGAKHYSSMDETARAEFLEDKLINDKNFIKNRIDAFLETVGDDGKDLRDLKGDIRAQTLHTIRRMQQAARLPHAYKRGVLAEYQNKAHYLEMIAISTACGAKLNITPLLEDSDTLKKHKQFFLELVTSPAILQHLHTQADGKLDRLMLPWMAAYSDNVKRGGITTRTKIDGMWSGFPKYIDETIDANWTQISAALKKAGIECASAEDFRIRLLPYHGKSHLHADRDGARSMTANMQDYCAPFLDHVANDNGPVVYFDVTRQGRDNSAKYHVADAVKRNLARNYSEGAQMVRQHRNGADHKHHQWSVDFMWFVAEAVQKSQEDYERDYFDVNSPHGEALVYPLIGDKYQSRFANGSTRGERTVAGESVGGIYLRGEDGKLTIPVAPDDRRAITKVEDDVNADSRLSALGNFKMEENINTMFKEHPKLAIELQAYVKGATLAVIDRNGTRIKQQGMEAFDAKGNLTVAGFAALRETMPFYKKNTDEIANALRCSDLANYARRMEREKKMGLPVSAGVRKDYENRVRDYINGSRLILKSFGIDPDAFDKPQEKDEIRIERMRHAIIRFAMPNSAGEIAIAQDFDRFGTYMRDRTLADIWIEGNEKGDRAPTADEAYRLRMLAFARGANSHGNLLTLPDSGYAHDRMSRLVRAVPAPALAA